MKLEDPEPPLFHQIEREEPELSLGSPSSTEHELPENNAPKLNITSAEATPRVSLIGTWNGKYTMDTETGIPISISITEENVNGAFKGYAIDKDFAWTVTGTLLDNKLKFIKSTCIPGLVTFGFLWTGTLYPEKGIVEGHWDRTRMVAEMGSAQHRDESKEDRRLEDEDRGDDSVLEGKDKFSLARRPPLDYFFYTPPDTEPQESRPKALWKIVRNAARHWYHSRHLTWDALRERRDRRKKYVKLYMMKEQYEFYDPYRVACGEIICRTHPGDLHLWRAIAEFQRRRMITLSYVYNINILLSLKADSCTDCPGAQYATIVVTRFTGAVWCVATVPKEGGQTALNSVRQVAHRRKIISVIFPHIHCFKFGSLSLIRGSAICSNEPNRWSRLPGTLSRIRDLLDAVCASRILSRRSIGAVWTVIVVGTTYSIDFPGILTLIQGHMSASIAILSSRPRNRGSSNRCLSAHTNTECYTLLFW